MLAGMVSLAVVAVAPGCDWLKGSELTARSSPFLNSLSISPAFVSCGTPFNVSFDYDDPQGDIFEVRVILRHEGGDASTRDKSTLWDDQFDRGSGRATYPITFECGGPGETRDPGGNWEVTVTVEDDLGHTSNILTGNVSLTTAG
jgi:hypothetical protein